METKSKVRRYKRVLRVKTEETDEKEKEKKRIVILSAKARSSLAGSPERTSCRLHLCWIWQVDLSPWNPLDRQ